jgi:hypothetical protein
MLSDTSPSSVAPISSVVYELSDVEDDTSPWVYTLARDGAVNEPVFVTSK